MTRLLFVVPVHGRQELTRLCLEQLRWTCDQLPYEASAIVVGDDANLETARGFGFGTVVRNNQFTSRKFNDGIQLACDPTWNPYPADFVVPCGSDDWVSPDLFKDLPDPDCVYGFQHISFVREDGLELCTKFLDYPGGCGIRIYPAGMLQPFGYRPAAEDLPRACDTSILTNIQHHFGFRVRVFHMPCHAKQIVDWKSPVEQLNRYQDLARHRGEILGDPFVELQGWWPQDALDRMQQHYAARLVAA